MSDISYENNIILEGSIDYMSVVTSTTFGLIEGDVEDNQKLVDKFATKQDVIEDLEEIRAGANKGSVSASSEELANETKSRQLADEQLESSIIEVDGRVADEEQARDKADKDILQQLTLESTARASNDDLLQEDINTRAKQTELDLEITNRKKADETLQANINKKVDKTSLSDYATVVSLNSEISTRETNDTNITNSLNAHTAKIDNPHKVTKTQVGLSNVDNTSDINKPISTATQKALDLKADKTIANDITAEVTRAKGEEKKLADSLATETSNRETKDTDLQSQIDALNSRSDVVDVVATKADLDKYSGVVSENDIIKVLSDETQNNATSYYRNSAKAKPYVWTLIGTLGQYYTKSEVDELITAEKNARVVGDESITSTVSTHTSNTSNPHKVTKAQVGLGNVDNTSDLNKPISTATQTALDKKQNTLVSGTTIKTINNQSILGSGNITIEGGGTEGVTSITAGTGLTGGTITTSGTIALDSSGVTAGTYQGLTVDGYGRVTKAVDKGYTTNTGTITGIKMNGVSKGTSGVVDLGTVITAHQDISGKVDNTEAGVNTAINKLSTGSSTPTDNDYYISQYVGGGTTTTTYHRRPMSALWKWISSKLATVATSGSYNDLSNKPTIPSVGNGTITITQNGTSKGTFTTNQSGNTTIALSDSNTNTTYKLSKSGSTITLTGSDGATTSVTDSNSITGVKGNAESSYRTGNVNITPANIGAVPSSEKGANSGVAPLNSTGIIDSKYLPSYVDDVLEFASRDKFPTTGEAGKIYVDTSLEVNNTYRWSGSTYILIAKNTDTTYKLSKSGSTITLTGSDGATTSVTDSNTTYSTATASANGLMSSTDKSKLDGLATVATSGSYNDLSNKPSYATPTELSNEASTRASADTTLQGNIDTVNNKFSNYYTKAEIDELLKNVLVINK